MDNEQCWRKTKKILNYENVFAINGWLAGFRECVELNVVTHVM